MRKIRFYSADLQLPLKGKNKIKDVLEVVFKEERVGLHSLSYIFCSDDYLLDVNKSFLNHDDYTDIITFDLSEGEGVIGEVYISIERVRENALIHNVSFKKEVLRVLFHGALHLCGYEDKKKSEITIMRQKEDYYLRLYEKTINES